MATLSLDYDNELLVALDELRAAQRVAIVTHVNPDGDTLGSALALMLGLQQLGTFATVYSADELPLNLAFLPGYGEIRHADGPPDDADLMVYVDSGDAGRFGNGHGDGQDSALRRLNIDHHATNHFFGDTNLVDPTAAATGEQVFELLRRLGVKIDPRIATCLLTAIITDTRAFRTPSTTPRTLAIASELGQQGAPLAGIIDSVYHNRSFGTLKIWGLALERMRCQNEIAWTEITEAMQSQAGASSGDGDGVIDLMSSLNNVQAVVLFKETLSGIKVSLRATGGLDVAAVASLFGGGGHPRAAGCLVRGRLAEVERKVLESLAERTAAR